jgi:hypothetical protein
MQLWSLYKVWFSGHATAKGDASSSALSYSTAMAQVAVSIRCLLLCSPSSMVQRETVVLVRYSEYLQAGTLGRGEAGVEVRLASTHKKDTAACLRTGRRRAGGIHALQAGS